MDPYRKIDWPYPIEWDQTERVDVDVLVLGGGIAGCWAGISSARAGMKTAIVEKGAVIRSGAGGSGCDHWESAATNPCSGVTPEELTEAMIKCHHGYNNGISHYIECREGFDRLLDLEKMGGKISTRIPPGIQIGRKHSKKEPPKTAPMAGRVTSLRSPPAETHSTCGSASPGS